MTESANRPVLSILLPGSRLLYSVEKPLSLSKNMFSGAFFSLFFPSSSRSRSCLSLFALRVKGYAGNPRPLLAYPVSPPAPSRRKRSSYIKSIVSTAPYPRSPQLSHLSSALPSPRSSTHARRDPSVAPVSPSLRFSPYSAYPVRPPLLTYIRKQISRTQ